MLCKSLLDKLGLNLAKHLLPRLSGCPKGRASDARNPARTMQNPDEVADDGPTGLDLYVLRFQHACANSPTPPSSASWPEE